MPADRSNDAEGRNWTAGHCKRIAYVLGTYPILTTTFIDRELLEAKRLGVDMVLIATRKAKAGQFRSEVMQLVNDAIYLLPVFPVRFVAAHFYFAATGLSSYFGTLLYLITRKHPTFRARIRTLFQFAEGVVAASLLRRQRVQHVHAHFADGAAVIAMVIHRLLRIPYSLTAHAVDIYVAPLFLAEKIENAKFAVTCTAYNKQHLERVTGQSVELIYHGIDFVGSSRRESPEKSEESPLILSVGQLKEKKGFPYLIHACALLKAREFRFRCEIIGDGAERERLSTLIQELDVSDVVLLRGALRHEEVLQEYLRATMFVLPSIVADDGNRDGIPNVILEAMSYGLPVVSTGISGIPEVVRNQETGWLVDSRNADELSMAIVSVLGNPELSATIGRNASRFVREEFDIRRNVRRLIELFAK